MRYGSSGNLTATQPDKTGIETIEKLKKFGYDSEEDISSHFKSSAMTTSSCR